MESTTNETGVIGFQGTVEQTEVSEGLQFARYCELEELPGLIFGVLTIAYIGLSLAGLVL
jgi:hypothetical protein